MKKLKNLLLALLSVTCIGAAAVGFAGCNGSSTQNSSSSEESSSSVEEHEHAWEEVSREEPTCTEDGKIIYECECGETKEEKISLLGHNMIDGVCERCAKSYSEGLEYVLNADNMSYLVKGIGACTDTDIIIPVTYKDLPVTSIGDSAFKYCSSLTNVVIGDSVTTIGKLAFYECSSLTSIEIPDGVTEIGDWAFEYCSSLTNVVIGDSVTTIGEPAFYNCSSLTSIEIPNSVTTIGRSVFYNCSSLTSIEIPDSVTTIGGEAFYKCSSLTSIAVDENNTKYKSIDGNLYTKDGTTLIQYAIGKTETEFVIPDGVTTISEQAFYNCDSLTSVEIGNSVTTIGSSAFENCSSLTSVVIPDRVTTILDYAFALCDSLMSVEIPNSITTIGNRAFYGCDSLTSIEIPDSVTTIGYNAFDGCSSLTIYCEAANQPSGWNANWNYSSCPVVWDYNNNDIATDGYIYTVIDGVRYAIKDGKAMLVSQPSNVTTANILESITYKEMEYSVTAIGNGVFRNCSSLASITVDENNGAYKSIDGNLYTKDGITLIQYAIGKTATEFIIPDSVTMIDRWAFFNCGSLTSVVIPDSVIVIGYSAFEGCTNLTSIEIPDSVIMIGTSAFEGCTNLTSITFEGTIEEWNAISKGMYWKSNVPATEVVCKDGTVAL